MRRLEFLRLRVFSRLPATGIISRVVVPNDKFAAVAKDGKRGAGMTGPIALGAKTRMNLPSLTSFHGKFASILGHKAIDKTPAGRFFHRLAPPQGQ